MIEPATLEVNGLSEFGVKVDVDRAYSRAPITGVTLGWWRKDNDEYRATHRERQRSKLGRMTRLRGQGIAALGFAAALSDSNNNIGSQGQETDYEPHTGRERHT